MKSAQRERMMKKEAELMARKKVQEEEKSRQMKKQMEEAEIQKQMALIRKEMEEKKLRASEEEKRHVFLFPNVVFNNGLIAPYNRQFWV